MLGSSSWGQGVLPQSPSLHLSPSTEKFETWEPWSRTALCGSEAAYYMCLFKLINTYSLSHQFFDPTGHVSATQWPHLTSSYTVNSTGGECSHPWSKSTWQGSCPHSAHEAVCIPWGQSFCRKRMSIYKLHKLLPVQWKFQPQIFLSMESARLPALTCPSKAFDSPALSRPNSTSGWNFCLCTTSASSRISLPEWNDVYGINRFSFPQWEPPEQQTKNPIRESHKT